MVQLVELEWEQERLEYYTSLLEKRQALVIRLAYFEGLPWDEFAKEAGAAVRTVHKIKKGLGAAGGNVPVYPYTLPSELLASGFHTPSWQWRMYQWTSEGQLAPEGQHDPRKY